jgi:DNA-binding MarR family transcriptional regulator
MADDDALRAAIPRALQAVTLETERYAESQRSSRGLHRTHVQALAHVVRAEREGTHLTPGGLAGALHLSAAATTALVDRMVQARHVVRVPSAHDRRSVTLEPTDEARHLGWTMFGPLGAAVGDVVDGYTTDELAVVERFLTETADAVRRAHEEPPSPRTHPRDAATTDE